MKKFFLVMLLVAIISVGFVSDISAQNEQTISETCWYEELDGTMVPYPCDPMPLPDPEEDCYTILGIKICL